VFESISAKFESVLGRLQGKHRLTERNIEEGLQDVRLALLEADVNYRVARDFIDRVKTRALGQEVIGSVEPGQQIVKIFHDELAGLMGPVDHVIPRMDKTPAVVMLVGLQGSGKTTTAGKLALYLQSMGRNPFLVAADVQRPAAIDQLIVLGEQIHVPVFSDREARPTEICRRAVTAAQALQRDAVILDTAGRLHIDEALMTELREIRETARPHQIYLVCDAMTGQDAVNSAKEFNDQLAIDGVILTKLDGDARGGAALSIKAVTGKPIKFIGVGEKLDKLEKFHPDRMASRILGMGDIVSLVERAQEVVDQDKAARMQEKILSNALTLEDFLDQLREVRKLGSIKDVLGMIPGIGGKIREIDKAEDEFTRVEAIICSMTKDEKIHPEIIDGGRRQRIAKGSGTRITEVNQLLKEFKQMRKVLKGMSALGKIGGLAPEAMLTGGLKKKGPKRLKPKKKKRKKRRR